MSGGLGLPPLVDLPEHSQPHFLSLPYGQRPYLSDRVHRLYTMYLGSLILLHWINNLPVDPLHAASARRSHPLLATLLMAMARRTAVGKNLEGMAGGKVERRQATSIGTQSTPQVGCSRSERRRRGEKHCEGRKHKTPDSPAQIAHFLSSLFLSFLSCAVCVFVDVEGFPFFFFLLLFLFLFLFLCWFLIRCPPIPIPYSSFSRGGWEWGGLFKG